MVFPLSVPEEVGNSDILMFNERSGTELNVTIWGFLLSFPLILKHLKGVLGLVTQLDTLAVASISATGFGRKKSRKNLTSPSSRADNCTLAPELTARIDKKWRRVQRFIKQMRGTENRFGNGLKQIYHAEGHLAIGETCKNNPDDFPGTMVYSEVSARDPIFYR